MTSEPTPEPEQPADWEAFYCDYRKPGYIEGFEITTKLGGGMFGLVFRARRMSIGKDYAIKFLKVDDGDVRRAILSELEQVKYFAQIDHPNLVAIEDRGEVSGIPYLVMAFAGSETLRDKMPVDDAGVGRIPDAAEKHELLRAFLQSCRGLQALHERSLVHFDIKPANVFLKGGVARLGDYGLSKLVTHSRGSLSMGRGTPYYMAPEMLKRRGDARSDIYSLGVMLYELLCGKVPFAGDSEWEVLRKHETAEPDLPAFLTAVERAVLQRCLQKEPEDRFESVQDLILAFGAPTSAAAAVWNDVREGAGPPPPPGSSAPPPPPPPPSRVGGDGDDHPYKEMADASKKAFRHANDAARDAMRGAHKTARKAMQEASVSARAAAKHAQAKWRESWQRTRKHSVRRWRSLTQLHKQKSGADRQAARRVATAIATPGSLPARKNPGFMRRAAWVAGALALLVLTLLAVWVGVLMPSGDSYLVAERTSDGPVPAPRQLSRARATSTQRTGSEYSLQPTYQKFVVPGSYDSLVSRQEPDWALSHDDNPRGAKRLLLERIGKLRQRAPIAPSQRVGARLPKFERTSTHPQERSLRDQIGVLTRMKSYKSTLARDIVSQGPVALALVAEAMTKLDYDTQFEVVAGARLHRLLVDATACRDLEFLTNANSDELRESNQALGHLWAWFVNEFAHSKHCWRCYQTLLK
ncbi:MAG: serine/threonine protein kinase [Planctomycetota bacterium]|jgi:serine/threonine protein kinase